MPQSIQVLSGPGGSGGGPVSSSSSSPGGSGRLGRQVEPGVDPARVGVEGGLGFGLGRHLVAGDGGGPQLHRHRHLVGPHVVAVGRQVGPVGAREPVRFAAAVAQAGPAADHQRDLGRGGEAQQQIGRQVVQHATGTAESGGVGGVLGAGALVRGDGTQGGDHSGEEGHQDADADDHRDGGRARVPPAAARCLLVHDHQLLPLTSLPVLLPISRWRRRPHPPKRPTAGRG